MSGLTTPTAWADKTEQTLRKVRAAMAADQERTFKAHWSEDEVREPLLALLGPKCWYCETTIQRADVNVDHFRPKSDVLGETGHDGYWWLAYRIDNYRIACKHCNSGGARFEGKREGLAKGARFPLVAGVRAWKEGDDLDLEQPLLLDPARPGDPDLLGFDTFGYARRSAAPYSPAESHGGVCRTEETIRILALNATQITDQRRELMEEIADLAQMPGPLAQKHIAKRVRPTAQWSAAATAALNLQRACALTITGPVPPAAAPPGTATFTPTPAPDRGRRKVNLKDLLGYLDPADLAAGITLTGRHDKRELRATLLRDGKISVLGRGWDTPTTAARVATGSDDVNGWDFWRLTVAGVEQSLGEFRDAHEPPSTPA